jgi:hypothetical protein
VVSRQDDAAVAAHLTMQTVCHQNARPVPLIADGNRQKNNVRIAVRV